MRHLQNISSGEGDPETGAKYHVVRSRKTENKCGLLERFAGLGGNPWITT
jgi:hypothetical protein